MAVGFPVRKSNLFCFVRCGMLTKNIIGENQEEEHMIGEMNTVDKSSKSEKIKVVKNPTIVPEEHTIKNQHLLSAAHNTIPSRDERMLSFMELLLSLNPHPKICFQKNTK